MELGAVDFGSLVTGDVSSTTMRCDGRPISASSSMKPSLYGGLTRSAFQTTDHRCIFYWDDLPSRRPQPFRSRHPPGGAKKNDSGGFPSAAALQVCYNRS